MTNQSSLKAHVLQCQRFVFLRTHARFQIAVAKLLKLISKIHEVKTTALWNRAARVMIFEFKEFLSSGNTRVRHHRVEIAPYCVAGRLGTTILETAWMIERLFVHLFIQLHRNNPSLRFLRRFSFL